MTNARIKNKGKGGGNVNRRRAIKGYYSEGRGDRPMARVTLQKKKKKRGKKNRRRLEIDCGVKGHEKTSD